MLPKMNAQDIDRIRASADIIEEASDLVTYLGFCLKTTTSEADPTWSIMKITQDTTTAPTVTRYQWADGFCNFDKAWSDRAAQTYYFKKF